MAHRETISEYEHCRERLNRLCKMNQFTDNFLRSLGSFGHANINRFIAIDPDYCKTEGEAQVYVWGKERVDQVNQTNGAIDIVKAAIDDISEYLLGIKPQFLKKILRGVKLKPFRTGSLSPSAIVFDSLNMIPSNEVGRFMNSIITSAQGKKTGILFLILDSSVHNSEYKIWEHACDIVIRLDYENISAYYTRNIEVVKARYQSHIWGKHPFKIYRPYGGSSDSEIMRRSHPYRKQGGIFIYPSIHYFLSEYKYMEPPAQHEMCKTLPRALNGILTKPSMEHPNTGQEGGFPRGRCTAFIGERGGHKSHLAYLHLLYRMLHRKEEKEGREKGEKKRNTITNTKGDKAHTSGEGAIIVSLRDDENMTRSTMNTILEGFRGREEFSPPFDVSTFEEDGRFEILYFHPGYITPQEVFHRIFIAIQRLKRKCKKVTVLFNSLDQLAARFPLCAKEEMFIPGIVNLLTGEQITSIIIAVPEEKGQPSEQYGLLPMADLILSFNRRKIITRSYLQAVQVEHHFGGFQKKAKELKKKHKEYVEEVVVEVVRFSGGQRAGACGILELVNEDEQEYIYDRSGLHFSPLSVGGWEYRPKTVVEMAKGNEDSSAWQ